MHSHHARPPVHRVVVPFDPAAPPPELVPVVPAGVRERWGAPDRSTHSPEIVAVTDGASGAWTGAALVTSRPGSAYAKIVDAVGDGPRTVGAVVAFARERGLSQVKWEGWTVSPGQAGALGFTPLESPSGQVDDPGQPSSGHVRWLVDSEVAEPPYYRQTTNFTCAAVTALTAGVRAGALSAGSLDRAAELALWREATNFPACEPVGLGLAVHRARPDATVTVRLDTDAPVLLDSYSGDEREWRAVLQRGSRADAARAGLPVDPRRLSPEELRATVTGGGQVLLLLSLATMQGFDVPHWVLCHGAVPGAVVVEDPWTNAATGDTWVDAHLLPVPDASLDAMSTMGPDGYRGAVALGHATGPGT
ncbi:peptidase C39 family protein [Nocardiopsis prasina]|uniref:peptidase C39 family protein n=1 Tax=Nocardiopsis prasina TaxID=2015 RepID=UPI00034899FD|nr:peptidase C39 family protein [Nocardiopsis prasina]